VLANLFGLVFEPTEEARIFTRISMMLSLRKLLRLMMSSSGNDFNHTVFFSVDQPLKVFISLYQHLPFSSSN